jgi:hypothetical protein
MPSPVRNWAGHACLDFSSAGLSCYFVDYRSTDNSPNLLETGVEQMPGEIRSSAHRQMNHVVDITDAVHCRIISDTERMSLAARGRLSGEEDNISLRRLIPIMREEAQFWFLAIGERGAVICSTGRIEYVIARHLAADVRDPDVQIKLMMAVNTYNPLSEAVLQFVDGGVSSVVVVGEGLSAGFFS